MERTEQVVEHYGSAIWSASSPKQQRLLIERFYSKVMTGMQSLAEKTAGVLFHSVNHEVGPWETSYIDPTKAINQVELDGFLFNYDYIRQERNETIQAHFSACSGITLMPPKPQLYKELTFGEAAVA
jgi:hypothetical protein